MTALPQARSQASTQASTQASGGGGAPVAPSINGMTLVDAQAGSGSWDNRYYITNETLSANGDYIEFCVSEINMGIGFGVTPTPTGTVTGAWKFWPTSPNEMYILLSGGIVANVSRPWQLFDRLRITKSGSNIVFSHNGVTVHTAAQSGTLYGYVGSHSGQGSVNIHSINGVAPTQMLAQNMTVTPGIPCDDFFMSDAAIYRSPLNWIGTGRMREASNPNAYLKTQFTGGRIGLLVDNTGSSALGSTNKTRIATRVDNGAWVRQELTNPTQSYFELATGLSTGTHTIEVALSDVDYGARNHATTRYGAVRAHGLRVPSGQTISAVTPRPILLMAFGDSNSEASESLGPESYAEVSFFRLIADAINAELAQSSAPGQGWISTPGAGILTVQNGWDLYSDTTSILTTGDIVPEPDIIAISHGQNDTPDPSSGATATINEMLAATTATKIVVMCPVNQRWRTELQAMVDAINNPRVLFFDNPTNFLPLYPPLGGAGPHMSQAGQQAYAAVMIPQFESLLGI